MLASTWPFFTVLPAATFSLVNLVVSLRWLKDKVSLSTASNSPTTLTVELSEPFLT